MGYFGTQVLGIVLKVLVKRDHWEYISLKGGPHQTGNQNYGHFWGRYFEQLPSIQMIPALGPKVCKSYLRIPGRTARSLKSQPWKVILALSRGLRRG